MVKFFASNFLYETCQKKERKKEKAEGPEAAIAKQRSCPNRGEICSNFPRNFFHILIHSNLFSAERLRSTGSLSVCSFEAYESR